MLRNKLFEDFFDNEEVNQQLEDTFREPDITDDIKTEYKFRLWFEINNIKVKNIQTSLDDFNNFNKRLKNTFDSMCVEMKDYDSNFNYHLSVNDDKVFDEPGVYYEGTLDDNSIVKISRPVRRHMSQNVAEIYFDFNTIPLNLKRLYDLVRTLYMLITKCKNSVYGKSPRVAYFYFYNIQDTDNMFLNMKMHSIGFGQTELLSICKKQNMTPSKCMHFYKLCEVMFDGRPLPKKVDVRRFFEDKEFTKTEIDPMRRMRLYDKTFRKYKDENGVIHITIPKGVNHQLQASDYYILLQDAYKDKFILNVEGTVRILLAYEDMMRVFSKLFKENLNELIINVTYQFINEMNENNHTEFDLTCFGLNPNKLVINIMDNDANYYKSLCQNEGYKIPKIIVPNNIDCKITNKTTLDFFK